MKGLPAMVAGVLAAMFAVQGCNTTGCLENRSSIPMAGFYGVDENGVAKEISLDSLAVHGIGAPADSSLLSPGTPATAVYLPLRSDDATTSFCFHYAWEELDDDALNDTLQFVYTSHPWLVSEECGAMYRYRITYFSSTHHLIDSVAILDSLVTNADRETLRIFFRTQ